MNWIGTPVHRRPHVETDDLDRNDEADDRRGAGESQIDRPYLRVTDLAEKIGKSWRSQSLEAAPLERNAGLDRGPDLDTSEYVLILGHGNLPVIARSADRATRSTIPAIRGSRTGH